LEGLATVHDEDRDFLAIGVHQRRVPVDVHLHEIEGYLAGHRVDHGPHLVAEVTVCSTIEGEAHRVVDTLRHLKYRRRLGAASPSCRSSNELCRHPYRGKAVPRDAGY